MTETLKEVAERLAISYAAQATHTMSAASVECVNGILIDTQLIKLFRCALHKAMRAALAEPTEAMLKAAVDRHLPQRMDPARMALLYRTAIAERLKELE